MNCYAEITESRAGRTAVALFGTPGLRRRALLPAGPVRGLFTTGSGRCFAASGAGFYEVFPDWSFQLWGSFLTSTGPVVLEENGRHVVAVDGAYGYAFDLTADTFTPISDPNFDGSSHVAFIDGYLLFLRPETSQFYWSGLYELTFDGADFATAEGSPERLRALLAAHRELWLFGTRRTEVWANVGAAPPESPFQRLQGAFLDHGIAAPHSACRLGEAVAWLAQDERGSGQVLLAQGYQPQRISTHAVETALASYATLSDAVGYTHQFAGHLEYVLSFPTAQATWAFDLASQLWHELGSLDPTTGRLGRHRSTCFTFAFDTPLVGDYADGRIYELALDAYTDDGSAIRREIVWPPVFDAERGSRILHRRFQVDLETGVGLDGGVVPGSDPQLMVSYSDDQGHTWKPERLVAAGARGETTRRAQLWRLGVSRDRRYKVAFSEPCKFAVLGAFLDVEPCAS